MAQLIEAVLLCRDDECAGCAELHQLEHETREGGDRCVLREPVVAPELRDRFTIGIGHIAERRRILPACAVFDRSEHHLAACTHLSPAAKAVAEVGGNDHAANDRADLCSSVPRHE
ncbi:MAG: hypothetical protein ABMB14_29060 [Myxococcota bacterium]